MAIYLDKKWKKEELLSFIGDIKQIAGAVPFEYSDGKAKSVRGVKIKNGSGLEFIVLPDRCMDIPEISLNGIPLSYNSPTGITSPVYFESSGAEWLRSFFVGLLTTCGLRNAGPPNIDQGEELGLHGRIGNTGAEDVSINQEWNGDEYSINVKGVMREAKVFFENMRLTRTISTWLGRTGFTLEDVVENRGFQPEPNLLFYHINFGFPLLGPNAQIIAPILKTTPRDDAAVQDKENEWLTFGSPEYPFAERVYFHELAGDSNGNTFVALWNKDIGNGSQLGAVIRYNITELPAFCEWKVLQKGLYVLGLEPGKALPVGREELRKGGNLPFIQSMERDKITIHFEFFNSKETLIKLIKERDKIFKG